MKRIMKRILSLFVIMLLFSSVLVFAQNDTRNDTHSEPALENQDIVKPELTAPGITPDSFLYFIDLALDNLALALTFDNDAKIEKELQIAEERLAEAREMALEGNLDAMTKAQEKHGEIFAKIKEDVKKISGDDSQGELKKELQTEQKIKEYGTKVKVVGEELKLKIKIKGEPTVEQQKLLQSILDSLEGQSGEVEIEINNEKGKTKIKIDQETGDSDEVEKKFKKQIGFDESEKLKDNEDDRDDGNQTEIKEHNKKNSEKEQSELEESGNEESSSNGGNSDLESENSSSDSEDD